MLNSRQSDPLRARKLPFRLCEVLEKEFVAVHGRPCYTPSWLLEPGHVHADLWDFLRKPAQADFPEAVAALRGRLVEAQPAFESDGDHAQRVQVLNGLLESERPLYDHRLIDRHFDVWQLADILERDPELGRETHTNGTDKTRVGQAFVLRNRLLLEAIVPDERLVNRVDSVRLNRIFEEIHKLNGPESIHSALCLSGGGIRSASFALGALQALARNKMLSKFDYLSTVSGGGYIGSWLSTWIHRHPGGLSGVMSAMDSECSEQPARSRVLRPEPNAIHFLRSYSHFLNPKAGLFSVDTWSWIGIYLRNLLLNWLAIIPLMLLLVGLPRLYASHLYSSRLYSVPTIVVLAVLAALAVVFTIVCSTINRPSLADPVHPEYRGGRPLDRIHQLLRRFEHQVWIFWLGIVPLAIFALLATLVVWELRNWGVHRELAIVIVLGGEAVMFTGWLISSLLVPVRDWSKRLKELVAMLAAGLITWLMVAGLAVTATHLSRSSTADRTATSPHATAPVAAEHATHRHLPESSDNPALALDDIKIYPEHLFVVFAMPVLLIAILTGMSLFVGAVSKFRWVDDEDREWWGRFGSWLLIIIVAWLALSAITIFGPPLLLDFPRLVTGIGGISGLIAVLLGKSSLTTASGAKAPSAKPAGKFDLASLSALGLNTLAGAAVVFFAFFFAALSLVTSAMLYAVLDWALGPGTVKLACGKWDLPIAGSAADVFSDPQMSLEIACQTPFPLILLFVIVMLVILFASAGAINLNKFSLHAVYRIRIVRTFLGASRRGDRRPNPFTGFDPLDNVSMHELQPGVLRDSDIIDLPGLVNELHQGLAQTHATGGHAQKKAAPYTAYLVRQICSPERDPERVLEGRLRQAQAGRPILKALQRDLLEALNRVMEAGPFDHAQFGGLVAAARAKWPDFDRFGTDGHVIFANRMLLQAAYPNAIRPYTFQPPPHKAIHILNLTLNLVHGKSLAWQERKAAPFAVSPMFSGSYYLGYRISRDYGGQDGISIGTAAAISGAAVSPNMGYSSSPVTALLLTLFNVRLGWWLGNPGIAGNLTYKRSEPRYSLHPLIAEALGMTDDRSPYVYLSDGGHFENLGMFEMVLRRCRLIVVTDAGADPDYRFDDLGNAVRKIRIDLGIPIEFTRMPIHKRSTPIDEAGRYCALGRIRYCTVDGHGVPDGILVYIKPSLYGNEPQDVLNYAAEHEPFPQESTVDQFFGEAQFESYRRLGEHEMERVCGDAFTADDGRNWAVPFIESVCQYLGEDCSDGSWIGKWIESCGGKPKPLVQPPTSAAGDARDGDT